jgi:hypothetical protein
VSQAGPGSAFHLLANRLLGSPEGTERSTIGRGAVDHRSVAGSHAPASRSRGLSAVGPPTTLLAGRNTYRSVVKITRAGVEIERVSTSCNRIAPSFLVTIETRAEGAEADIGLNRSRT